MTQTHLFICSCVVTNNYPSKAHPFQLFSNFWRFWYHKKDYIFLIIHGKFQTEKHSIWKILMKMCLVMVIIIKLTQ